MSSNYITRITSQNFPFLSPSLSKILVTPLFEVYRFYVQKFVQVITILRQHCIMQSPIVAVPGHSTFPL